MGGKDITSTAWDSSTKTITISQVTGDIIITTNSRFLENIKNLLPLA
jgi:hypothetical protein